MPGAFGRMPEQTAAAVSRSGRQVASVVTLGRGAPDEAASLWVGDLGGEAVQSADGHSLSRPSWSLDDAVWVVVDTNVVLRAIQDPASGQPARIPVDSTAVASRFPGAINDLQLSRDGTRAAMVIGGQVILAGVEQTQAGQFALTYPRRLGFGLGSSVVSLSWRTGDDIVVTRTDAAHPVSYVNLDGVNSDAPSRGLQTPLTAIAANPSTVYVAGPQGVLMYSASVESRPGWADVPGLMVPGRRRYCPDECCACVFRDLSTPATLAVRRRLLMSPRVPRLRWDDPFRALDMLASLWSSTGMSLVSAGAAQAVAAPYRTLFTTLQQLLIGKEVTVRIGDHDVVLTVTELDSALEPQGLAVGQLGEVRVAARGISWDQHHLHSAVAVLRNVHIRPGVPPLVIAAPVELSSALPTEIFDDVLRQATPQLRGELSESGAARLRWARRPDWGGLEVDVDVAGTTSQTTLWLRPRTVITGQRRWTLPARTPAYRVPLPELPHGLRITDVSLAADCLQLSALLPEWRTELPLRYLESVITQLSQGALSFVWPPLRSGAD